VSAAFISCSGSNIGQRLDVTSCANWHYSVRWGDMPITNDILLEALSVHGRFHAQDSHALASLACRGVSLPRDAVVRLDDDATFVVVDGWIAGAKIGDSGERQICAIHIEGDLVDVRRLFVPTHELEYRALSAARVAHVSSSALRDLCRTSFAITCATLRSIAVAAAVSEEWVVNIGRRRALHRVAHLICELISRIEYAAGGAEPRYAFPLTQVDLGDATGISAVHVNRVLQELRGRQFLEFRGGQLTVLDREGLATLAEFDPGYLYQGAPNELAP
jgi:CRP-like cAMP-binding protein